MKTKLTDRQREVLDLITESLTERGYSPTFRELGDALGIRSTNGVNDHLRALERKGYIVREELKSRTIQLVERPSVRLDVLAWTDGVTPVGHMVVDRQLLGSSRDGTEFFVIVHRGAAVDDDILEGDSLVVRRQSDGTSGDLLLFKLSHIIQVRRVYHDRSALEILGRVVSVCRRLT